MFSVNAVIPVFSESSDPSVLSECSNRESSDAVIPVFPVKAMIVVISETVVPEEAVNTVIPVLPVNTVIQLSS